MEHVPQLREKRPRYGDRDLSFRAAVTGSGLVAPFLYVLLLLSTAVLILSTTTKSPVILSLSQLLPLIVMVICLCLASIFQSQQIQIHARGLRFANREPWGIHRIVAALWSSLKWAMALFMTRLFFVLLCMAAYAVFIEYCGFERIFGPSLPFRKVYTFLLLLWFIVLSVYSLYLLWRLCKGYDRERAVLHAAVFTYYIGFCLLCLWGFYHIP